MRMLWSKTANKAYLLIFCVVGWIFLNACTTGKSEDATDTIIPDIVEYQLLKNVGNTEETGKQGYVLEKDMVSNGVYVSENLQETEAFVAELLMEVLLRRGSVPPDLESFFSENAIQQLRGADWTLVEESWSGELYYYDSWCDITWFFGDSGYDFTYSFWPDNEVSALDIRILTDHCGIVRSVGIDSHDAMCISADNENEVFNLFYEKYCERIIQEGLIYQGKILADFSDMSKEMEETDWRGSFPESEDAALSAKILGDAFINMMEEEPIGENWKANRYYDCYYIDAVRETGCVGFVYCFYPDYGKMGVESAEAVLLRCGISIGDGELCYADMMTCIMSIEEYHAAREWIGQRASVLSVKVGDVIKSASSYSQDLGKLLVSDIAMGTLKTGNVGALLTDRITGLTNLEERLKQETEKGWRVVQNYDCYYYNHMEQEGRTHYRYYFYWERQEENYKTLALDLWISEDGIEALEDHWYLTCGENGQQVIKGLQYSTETSVADIKCFLDFDWTTDKVLMEHAIQPNDSARGWEFALADVDFDEKPELLITFTANHCGGNSLYIYGQNKEKVVSKADTYATWQADVVILEDYRNISSYFDIGLLDAYVNMDGTYRYLSLDYELYGGDIRGGIEEIKLYATDIEIDGQPMEVVKINCVYPGNYREMSFKGEEIYELGMLRDMLEEYMDGFQKVEIEYQKLEAYFPRDIVGMEENEKKQYLETFRKSLEAVYEK